MQAKLCVDTDGEQEILPKSWLADTVVLYCTCPNLAQARSAFLPLHLNIAKYVWWSLRRGESIPLFNEGVENGGPR